MPRSRPSARPPGARQGISIDGLREFRAALKKVDSQLAKAMKDVGNRAAKIVVDEAKPRVPTVSGRAAKSVRLASTGKAARVAAGGKRVPYFGWLDFGGAAGPGRKNKRPFLVEGRYVWKAFDDNRERIAKELDDGFRELARAAGLDLA